MLPPEGWYNVPMPEAPRIAQPGDIFILLVPTTDDLAQLRQKHADLQAQFGGQLVEPIHITAERFSPENGHDPQDCIAPIRRNLSGIQPFPIEADGLIQFFAPYWQSQVLRWRVAETRIWNDFRDTLEDVLCDIGCPSHFIRRRYATCTILKLEGEIDPSALPQVDAMPLFWVRELWISLLKADGQFEIVEKLILKD